MYFGGLMVLYELSNSQKVNDLFRVNFGFYILHTGRTMFLFLCVATLRPRGERARRDSLRERRWHCAHVVRPLPGALGASDRVYFMFLKDYAFVPAQRGVLRTGRWHHWPDHRRRRDRRRDIPCILPQAVRSALAPA